MCVGKTHDLSQNFILVNKLILLSVCIELILKHVRWAKVEHVLWAMKVECTLVYVNNVTNAK